MTDEQLALEIAMRKASVNPETGKNFGLRVIAEQLDITYGKARHIDNKYNKAVTKSRHHVAPREWSIEAFKVFVWDLETTNLNAFMGQLIVASFLDLNTEEIETRTVMDFDGDEQMLLHWTLDMMEQADILIGHNTIGFDTGFLRGRLALHGIERELPKRMHYDTYQIARHGFKGRPQGYSLENLADFFRLPVLKDKPSKHDWAASIILDEEAIERIADRCEADVLVNAYLWQALRPSMNRWKGR